MLWGRGGQKEKDKYHVISSKWGVRFLINVHNVQRSNFQRTNLQPMTCDTDSSHPQRKAKVVTARQYPRLSLAGSAITVLIEQSAPTDGSMVINTHSILKRFWIQIPLHYSVL